MSKGFDSHRAGSETDASCLASGIQPFFSLAIFRIWALFYLFALLLLLFVTPPFQVPDEPNHFYRVYQLAEGHILPDHPRGGLLPTALAGVPGPWTGRIIFKPEQKFDLHWLRNMWRVRVDPADRSEYTFVNTAINCPIPYLPHLGGLLTGRALGLPPLGFFYTARLVATFAAWALVLWCFRLAPPATHPVLALLFMSPMFMYLAPAVTADTVTTLCAIAFTAAVLRECTAEGPIVLKSRLTLIFLTATLALCKPPYVILAAMLTFIPSARFPSSLQKWLWAGAWIVVAAAIAAIWNTGSRSLIKDFCVYPHYPIPHQQAELLLARPLRFFRILRDTLAHFGWSYISGWVGQLGWTEVSLPKSVVVVYLAAFFALATTMSDPRLLSTGQKVFVLMLIIAGVTLNFLAVYLYFTPVGHGVVLGFQGRYLLPYGLAAAALLAHLPRAARLKRISWKAHYALALGVGTIAFTIAIYSVFKRYYVQ